MTKGWSAAGLILLLAGTPVFAADLKSDAEALLRRVVADPDVPYVVQSTSRAVITEEGDEVTIKIGGLSLALKANPAVGLVIGDIVAHVHRRADGGVEASVDLPKRMAVRGPSLPAPRKFDVEDAKLLLGWGGDLGETDRVLLAVASISDLAEDETPNTVVTGVSLSTDRTVAHGKEGRFAFSIGGVRELQKQAPIAVDGLGPFVLEGHYENFPADRYRLLFHHLMLWEHARAPRGDASANLGGFAQGMALLQEAQTHYVIDKITLQFGSGSFQAESDLHFSLDAANGLSGSATAWLVEANKTDPANANPTITAGTQLATPFGVPGKAPDGSDARVFHVELAADGQAKLNGEPSPILAIDIAGALKLFAVMAAGAQTAPQPVAVQSIPGTTGCGVPVYPKDSLAANEAGQSVLTFDYDETGALKMTHVRSSGFSRLDDAARVAYITCKFPPGTTSAVIPVIWKIENGRGISVIGAGLTTTSK